LADRQTGRQADRQTGRQADRQTGRQADRQTDRQTDRQADRQTGRQADKADRQTDKAKNISSVEQAYTGKQRDIQSSQNVSFISQTLKI
jgi:hypothetical protein